VEAINDENSLMRCPTTFNGCNKFFSRHAYILLTPVVLSIRQAAENNKTVIVFFARVAETGFVLSRLPVPPAIFSLETTSDQVATSDRYYIAFLKTYCLNDTMNKASNFDTYTLWLNRCLAKTNWHIIICARSVTHIDKIFKMLLSAYYNVYNAINIQQNA
jgi:hypothetical protein